MPVRQVQAPQAPRRDLREVRRRSHAVQGAPRAHGPHRAGHPGRPHLVPEVAAVASGHGARHDAARHRTRALLRRLRGGRARHDAAQPWPAADRGRLPRQAGRVRRRVQGADGRGRRARTAALARPAYRSGNPACGNQQDRFRYQAEEAVEAPEDSRGLPEVRHQARVDDPRSAAGAAARTASAGAAGWRPLRDLRSERPVSSRDQPQQPAQEASWN